LTPSIDGFSDLNAGYKWDARTRDKVAMAVYATSTLAPAIASRMRRGRSACRAKAEQNRCRDRMAASAPRDSE
jgi:hypothetical protein